MAFGGVGDGQRRDNGWHAFNGWGAGLWWGGGEATAAMIVFNGGGGRGLTVDGSVWLRRGFICAKNRNLQI